MAGTRSGDRMTSASSPSAPQDASLFTRAAVVGSGYMGSGIAQVMAMNGVQVSLADQSAATASQARDRMLAEVAAQERRKLVPLGSAERVAEQVIAAETLDAALADAEYVTEAVFEDAAVKAETLSRISDTTEGTVVIGSNTSAIPIGQLAESVRFPERFLGVHWMNPAPFIPGIELIPTDHTDPDVLARVHTFLTMLGKRPTRVSDAPGFVANRLQFALYREAVLMLQEGLATPAEIDEVVSNTFGFRLAIFGPLTIGDMAGLDVYDASYTTLSAAYGERFASPTLLKALLEAGEVGLKAQRGVYEIPQESASALIEYREFAYAKLSELKTALGRPPVLDESESSAVQP